MQGRGKSRKLAVLLLVLAGLASGCAAPRAVGGVASGVVKTAGRVASTAVKTTGKAVGAVTAPLRGGRR